jgi:hypothetical protein
MITITIELNDNGGVKVLAPFDQKMVCYGLLEVAKEIISKMNPVEIVPEEKQESKKIISLTKPAN